MFSLYGEKKLTDRLFVQGVFSHGNNTILNHEKRIVNKDLDQKAFAKYDVITYGGELITGYRYTSTAKNITFTQTIGVNYSKIKSFKYDETGTDRRNLSVSVGSFDNVEGIVGASLARVFQINDLILTPEIHASANYKFKRKNPAVEAYLNGATKPMPTSDSSKSGKDISTNLGATIGIKDGIMEYGASYDAYMDNKYLGHQASCKIRVNF